MNNELRGVKVDPKAYYRYANSKMKARESVGPLEDKNGNIVCDDKRMREILNKYFSIVYTKEDLENIAEPRVLFNGENLLEEMNITNDKVLKKLQELNPEKSHGNDTVHPAI
ncbi:hypothetical protein Pcinc_009689 [Petrolisthes cinctipes]|uniref:Uncharacterized protein n=1 Tax=Petrolisthes cinctipes TaxID=88211 RepID=A0AAE1KY54_PETCI|nr:hypothetical protein Pcinc_009682 [Petrolisthes cinctipes]KAK3886112.1 hypothetical protein Pcinc_009689 [Petrolisthes cinctipes]